MMREVGKKVKINKFVEVEETVTKEKITIITTMPEQSTVNVTIKLLNADNMELTERLVTITGEDYELLYSTNMLFDEGKQLGSYRESDLWKMIDKVTIQ